MRITCPKCQFKGLIDTAPLAFETQVACVRCGTTFDALLIEGEIQTFLLPNDDEDLHAQAAHTDSSAQVMQPGPETEDVLALPQPPEVSHHIGERVPIFEDVLMVSPVDAGPVEQTDVPANQTEERAEEPAVALAEVVDRPLDLSQLPTTTTGSEPGFEFGQPLGALPAGQDRHDTRMRLMRISPLWLLVCGMTFISVIVLSNQFAKPAEQEQRASASYTSPGNKATNQALAEPPMPASANPAASSMQDASQTAAPAAVEAKDEKEASVEKAEAEDDDEPEASPAPEAAPVVETKSDVAVPAPQSQSEKAGGLTVQIGSYNVIEQANEKLASLRAAGFEARVVSVEIPKRGTWYRVHAGRFNSREEAARYGNEMKSKGAADNFIVTDVQGGK
ncbi:MAG TPA: SPOR domain-containing protein [Pyrinomonadaceae bacterium]|jgi:cell division protein FtsN